MAQSNGFKVFTKIDENLNFVHGTRHLARKPTHRFNILNPATGETLAQCGASGVEDVNKAVDSAKSALPAWAKMSGLQRGHILRKAGDLIKENLEDIARWEVISTGKPIYEARIDVSYAADTLIYYGGLAADVRGDQIPVDGDNSFVYTRREPLGVCVGIGAWNYPFQTCSWKCAPALATGNTMVYKPSPWACVTPLIMAEILSAAGLPDGVFNVVQGERETGEILVSHLDVPKVSFTGSVVTGQGVMEACARSNLKRVTLELGGKSPLIIFDDCNLENAINGALNANFFTQGQVCCNGTRVFVHEKIYDEFLARLVERTKLIKIGNPLYDDTKMGAIINEQHLKKILGFIQRAVDEGAKLECGSIDRRILDDEKCRNGFFLAPCILAQVHDGMEVVKEEIFGPVLSLLKFSTEDEVVQRANNTKYGLAAGLFSQNLARAHRVAAKLQAGLVWINNYNVQPVEAPFGGYKMSGFGRELGREALNDYTQTKSVFVELGDVETGF